MSKAGGVVYGRGKCEVLLFRGMKGGAGGSEGIFCFAELFQGTEEERSYSNLSLTVALTSSSNLLHSSTEYFIVKIPTSWIFIFLKAGETHVHKDQCP